MSKKKKGTKTFITWDGKDPAVFFEILESALENEKITVHRTGTHQPAVIERLEDIERILPRESGNRIPRDGNLPEKLKRRIIRAAVPSVPMQGYLMKKQMQPVSAAELIFKSPAALRTKANLIKELAAYEDFWRDTAELFYREKCSGKFKRELYEWFLHDSLHMLDRFVTEALENLHLKEGEIFYLKDAWYDEDYKDEHDTGLTAVTSFEAAKEAIHKEYAYEGWDSETEDVWIILDKLVPGKDGIMFPAWRYYMIYDQPVYFEKLVQPWKDPDNRAEYSVLYGKGDGGILEYLVPFSVGTVLSIGSFPFSPVKPGVLIENFKEFVEILCRGKDGEWQIVNIAHGMEWGFYRPMLSSLYRIEPYKGKLETGDKILLEVSRWLSENEEKGHRFWNAFEQTDERPEDDDPELKSILVRLKGQIR